MNLVVFAALIPAVIYASLRPLFCYGYAHFLETYESLPTVSVLPKPGSHCDDLSLYLLLLEENISELKSYKYMKVCCIYTVMHYMHVHPVYLDGNSCLIKNE